MKLTLVFVLMCSAAWAQSSELGPLPKQEPFVNVVTEQQQPAPQPADTLSNYHILLSPASEPGAEEPKWLAIGPDGQLLILPVSEVKERLAHGYRAYTFGELREALRSIVAANNYLTSQLARAKNSQTQQVQSSLPPQYPTEAELRQAEQQRRNDMKRQALLLFMLGQQQHQFVPLPPPPVFTNHNINCTSRSIGTTVFTDCN